MKHEARKLKKAFKKGDYLIVLEKAKRKNQNLNHDNVLAFFNGRAVAEEKSKPIYSAAKSLYKTRTGKKFEEV